MAPSRALSRCAALLRLRTTPRPVVRCRISNQSTPLSTYSRPFTRSVSASSQCFAVQRRLYSSQESSGPAPPDYLSEGELHVFNKIKAELEPVDLEVQDISGGCGSMYALNISSPKFAGLSVIKQHKLVNSILADEIKSWHGVQLRTRAA
ncbi:bola-like protein [Delitschia confertaspora ATCC 74209]|uniref:Bola-like protein n=1 Tax=Delitschia confertaspora ATCC 74209 TaxID=1513339 RepID=A0A9P4JGP0_9PLEO|nr:bola-like protein [Delitschia confertaspora ATCC 74209]